MYMMCRLVLVCEAWLRWVWDIQLTLDDRDTRLGSRRSRVIAVVDEMKMFAAGVEYAWRSCT